jgi:hypothetical protein
MTCSEVIGQEGRFVLILRAPGLLEFMLLEGTNAHVRKIKAGG